MGKLFDLFPKVLYDLDGNRNKNYSIFTNIFIRIGLLSDVKNNDSLFYLYQIQDGDTPEMIADKYYGDAELHWIVLYMNDIIDPFYDWPLSYEEFNKYIIGKYGSFELANTTIHHYEKQIVRVDSSTLKETTSKMVIDPTTYASLASSTFNTYDLSNNTTVSETITKNAVTCWTYELELNEAKRNIKLLKKEYAEKTKLALQNILESAPRVARSVLIGDQEVVRQ